MSRTTGRQAHNCASLTSCTGPYDVEEVAYERKVICKRELLLQNTTTNAITHISSRNELPHRQSRPQAAVPRNEAIWLLAHWAIRQEVLGRVYWDRPRFALGLMVLVNS